MKKYLVEENRVDKRNKKQCGEILFFKLIKDRLNSISQLEQNPSFLSLIKRNIYLELYSNKPLIEDCRQTKESCYSVEIPENILYKGKSNNAHEMDWNDYHHLDVIERWMDSLEKEFPSICTVFAIGTSVEGRLIKVMKVSNSAVENSPVWLDAGIHAREWIAPAVNTFIADFIVRNFWNLPECFTNKDWYFLPVVNPDGYDYSHKEDRMWRKNRAWYGGECHGVDLNRNFRVECLEIRLFFNWFFELNKALLKMYKLELKLKSIPYKSGFLITLCVGVFYPTAKAKHHTNYVYEVFKAYLQKDALENSGIKFKVYVTLHSYGQVIIFPFGYRDELCPDYIRLLQGATVMSKAIFASTGNTYKVGISKDVMYGASGTSTDWTYGAANIPFSYLIELRSKKHKFNLPREEIQETCNEILNCIRALMEFVDKYHN